MGRPASTRCGPVGVDRGDGGHLPVTLEARRAARRRACAIAGRRLQPVRHRTAAGGTGDRRAASRSSLTTDARLAALPRAHRRRDAAVRRRRRGRRDRARLRVSPRPATGRPSYAIEPDASAALVLLRRRRHHRRARDACPGSAAGSLQGDLGFVDLLARMGATVEQTDDADDRRCGARPLHGIEVDMADALDTAPTLAAVAAFARQPDPHHGRRLHPRQGDRPHRRSSSPSCAGCGVDADEEPDGFVVRPGRVPAGARPHLRRPPHGHGVRPGRAARAGRRDRGPDVRGQDVPRVLSTGCLDDPRCTVT